MANIKQISDKDMLDIILDIFEYMTLDVNDLSMVYLELSSKNTREFDSVIINMLNYCISNILNHIKYARTRDYNYVDILAGTSFDKEE
ncbi:hypothetical protein V3Y64_000622 [Campylobacter upsaliensis]|uniref:Uncharacterized protein n=1 Tax=Campylobacter upsaliensis TaxID=28080 RepID=A0A5L4Z0C9_CAMUP|nr:hypothetical protein [Campylobacter upsaliensis]EAH6868011.1 hypothetical protein [Campylobacter upsaliensis]EAH9850293.1 hypothetical protein [Campylobacter upsaliensis]EAI4340104.1 hypothetical protein [Campylobacter upsaliensis]EAI7245355.1 hypothetical protein [Campylobacter upsaliensis]EAJ0467861.1 hypothetical protein [Campylobacter upsaliensis]